MDDQRKFLCLQILWDRQHSLFSSQTVTDLADILPWICSYTIGLAVEIPELAFPNDTFTGTNIGLDGLTFFAAEANPKQEIKYESASSHSTNKTIAKQQQSTDF